MSFYLHGSAVFAEWNQAFYAEMGYKSIDGAVKDFVAHDHQPVSLPLRIPPIAFTHAIGRFNELDGEVNDYLEIVYLNEQVPANLYIIQVRPIQNKTPFKGVRDKDIKDIFTLENGKEALLIQKHSSHMIVYENEHFQYQLSANEKLPPQILLQIANTIE